jgi:hypothetical protein
MKLKRAEVINMGIALAIVGLPFILFLWHSRATAEASAMAQSGKNIYVAVCCSELDKDFTKISQFRNSTDYFRELFLGNRWGNLNLYDLSAGIMPVSKTADAFMSPNNGWIVRASPALDKNQMLYPLLISRNQDVSGLSECAICSSFSPVYNLAFKEPDAGQPKWGRRGVVVFDNGSIEITRNVEKGFRAPDSIIVAATNICGQPLIYLAPDGIVEMKGGKME